MKEIPLFLYQKLSHQYGEKLTKQIIHGYQKKRTTVRINRLRITVEEAETIFKQNDISFEKLPFFEDAFLLLQKGEDGVDLRTAHPRVRPR